MRSPPLPAGRSPGEEDKRSMRNLQHSRSASISMVGLGCSHKVKNPLLSPPLYLACSLSLSLSPAATPNERKKKKKKKVDHSPGEIPSFL